MPRGKKAAKKVAKKVAKKAAKKKAPSVQPDPNAPPAGYEYYDDGGNEGLKLRKIGGQE